MPEFCTCGAQLAEDSLFCHKCGKPQRDLVDSEVDAAPPEPIPPPPVQAPAPPAAPLPTFGNPVAFRIALMIAVFATFLSFLPYLNWLAAGYFSAFFYRRRTGTRLNVIAGVRMGWITGVLIFGITAALFTAFVVLFNASSGNEIFQAQIRTMSDPRVPSTSWVMLKSTPTLVGTPSQATFRAVSGGKQFYNGHWLEMQIPVSAAYAPGPNPASWYWQLQYVTSKNVEATDTLTVAVGIHGVPARLISG